MRVFEAETRRKEGSFEHQQDEVLERLVVLVGIGAKLQGLDDRVVGVDLEVLLGHHVAHRRSVTKSLSLHDALHVGRPTVLRCHDAAGRRDQAVRNGDL